MSSAKNYSVSWFGLFTWPNLIGKNEAAFRFLRNTMTCWAMCCSRSRCCTSWRRSSIISGTRTTCCCACCRSGQIGRGDHDGTTRGRRFCRRSWAQRRMRRPRRRRRPSYVADPSRAVSNSRGQAGAEFKGVFHRFAAAVEFSPDALAAARFDVQIDLNSLDTGDKDRDETMRGADIFDVAHFPTAHYVTRSFDQNGRGLPAVGALTLRGVTKEVPIDFNSFRRPPAAPDSTGTASSSAWISASDKGSGRAPNGWRTTSRWRSHCRSSPKPAP